MGPFRRLQALQVQLRAAAVASGPPQFAGALDLASLAASPLEELRSRSEARGLCDRQGNRCKGAPWGMQLAHAPAGGSPFPVIRTVGFQRVTGDSFSFLLKRAPEGSPGELQVSAVYVEGKYAAGEVCEQWRVEGLAREVPVAEVLATAPLASFAQIIVAGGAAHGAASGDSGRGRLEDRESFVNATAAMKERLAAGQVPIEEIGRSVVVYDVRPVRAELLIGGPDFPMWERVEWRRGSAGDTWQPPMRILPY